MNYVIKSESLTVTVSSLGAELISAVGADGFEYIWQNPTGEFWGGHAPLLFPHCGRILNSEYTYGGERYEMGIHGFARKSEFKLINRGDSFLEFSLESSEETKKIYPFDFELKAEYKLIKNSLFANFTVQNKDKNVLPYMFGWHPGFNLDDKNGAKTEDFHIDFDGVSECLCYPLQNGGFVAPAAYTYSLPGGRYQLSEEENAREGTMIFVGTGNCAKLSSPKSEHGVAISYSENLPYFCIWKWESADAKYICLEPWSDVPGDGIAPESFDTKKMSRLPSGEGAVYSYTVDFKA